MSNFPYPIYGTITASDSTTPSTRVTLRNDRTGDQVNVNSNTLGQYVTDAGNFTNGYMESDRVTIIVGYGAEEGSDSILISSGTHNIDITLAEIAESTDVTYCQIQDVLDELGDKTTSDISYERVRKIILRAEAEIDERASTSFKSNTATDEIHDFDQYSSYRSPEQQRSYATESLIGSRNDYMNTYYNDKIRLLHSPVIAITSLYRNNAGKASADSWEELTEQTGSGGDFIVDYDNGFITFIQDMPSIGMRRLKTTYTYGKSTVPKIIERLTILLSVRDILMSKGHNSQFDSIDNISLEGISISKGISGTIEYFKWLTEEIDKLWQIVGDQFTDSA